jgi:hypothetical protein
MTFGACGDDEEPSGTASRTQRAATADTTSIETAPGPAVGRPRFVQELNRICRDANAKLRRVNADIVASVGNRQAVASALDEAVAVYESVVPKLKELEVPAEDREAFARFREAADQDEDTVRRMARAARAGDNETLARLSRAGEATARTRVAAARALGAKECGQRPGGAGR